MIVELLLQGLGFGFAAAAQPGPFQAFLLSLTLRKGWRRALPAAAAPLVSDGPIILLTVGVLSRLPGWFQQGLRFAGGVLLLYLAAKAYRRARLPDPEPTSRERVDRGSLWEATAMNALNPGPWLFWSLVTGPILLAAWRESPAAAAAFLGGFYGTIVTTLVGLVLLFGSAGRLGPRGRKGLGIASAAVLLAFGLYQLTAAALGAGG